MVRAAGFDDVQVFGVHHGPRLQQRPGLIAEQIEASLSGVWPAELEAFVAGVSDADFEIRAGDVDASLDLVVIAR